jgi:CCR4-NOT transcription complex subunit 1
MLNNIRFPNPITFYFKNLLIMIFNEQTDDGLQEQITRNLFERLMIEKPHSWGILSFFYNILANVNFKFDTKRFYVDNEKFIERMIAIAFRYARIKDEKRNK